MDSYFRLVSFKLFIQQTSNKIYTIKLFIQQIIKLFII